MRQRFILLSALLFSMTVQGQQTNPMYDSTLAKTLGADDYGMKKYVFVILKTGPNTQASKALSDSLFAGHMQNINRLADAGKLVVAGPFMKNDRQYRGIFILNVTTIEEAKDLLQTDPAIKGDLLSAELIPWYGSAALSEYLKAHELVWKRSF